MYFISSLMFIIRSACSSSKAFVYGICILILCVFDAYTADPFDALKLTNGLSDQVIQLLTIMTCLSIVPSIMIAVTSFTRIVIVLSFIRSAIGLHQSPPNIIITTLAIMLTIFVMQPVFLKAYDNGISPFMRNEIKIDEALDKTLVPFKEFVVSQVNENEVRVFAEIAKIEKISTKSETPWRVLLPSFLVGELKKAFEIGFLIFLPFFIIDIVISCLLMAMGMMMVSPAVISLPIKIIFFVMIDGWNLLCSSLAKGFL